MSNDKDLIDKFIEGDKKSFELLINRYLKSVYNYIFRTVNDKGAAEDIVQEVFIKVWKNLDKFNQENFFKTWIFTIARNTAIDSLRKRKNVSFSQMDSPYNNYSEDAQKSFEETLTDIEPLPDEIFIKKELGKELENALLKIRPDFREIILLHYTEDLTFEEISKIVDKPLNTVKSHHLRALSSLRKFIIE
jgi:RNA polymerase sigma factor (sigma-70 family)